MEKRFSMHDHIRTAIELNNVCSTVNNSGKVEHSMQTAAFPDSRFEDKEFRFCVHVVLEYFGLDATFGNFKKLESQFAENLSLDWYEIARGILNPSHEARVYRLITNPRAGPVGTRCGTMIVELRGVTKEEALKSLDTKKYEFIEWW